MFGDNDHRSDSTSLFLTLFQDTVKAPVTARTAGRSGSRRGGLRPLPLCCSTPCVFFHPLDESFLWYHHSIADAQHREVRFVHLVGTSSISFVSPEGKNLSIPLCLLFPPNPLRWASTGALLGAEKQRQFVVAFVTGFFHRYNLLSKFFRTVCPLKLKFCKTSD